MKKSILLSLVASVTAAHADPQLTSWFTTNSGQYARIYQSSANETAATKSTTWSRGSGTQTYPAYADVNEIAYSANWIYIKTTGLASHVMGPWYLDAAKTANFPSFPSNTGSIYRIPRVPTIPTSKTSTGFGTTGRMVNGVSIFDSRDSFSYKNSSATDATPTNGLTGDGIWNRDGYHNEGITFDPALAHQAGNNYHYHAQPIALRYQLGDHVDYNATTNRYTESTAAPSQHSPILGWAADGLPVYGPYGYSSPLNAASGVRRMVSGFVLRDGSNNTADLTTTGRHTLPAWAQRIQNRTTLTVSQYGPAVSTTYLLGHYIEDYDFLGDRGYTLGTVFDLNEQNVRFCVTPEFPAGTWAYFTTTQSDGTPAYPYTTGRQYYGSPTGAGVTSITETVTSYFLGGANTPLAIKTASVSGGTVTLTWSAVEGGTYAVDASPNQSTWTSKATGLVATATSKALTYTALGSSGTEYGRVKRTALATYDTTGQTAATVAQTAITSYTFPTAIQSWQQQWYGSTTISAAADTSDPYNTGVSNLAVFAFFGPSQNPASVTPSLLPQAQLDGGNFFFNFTQPAGVSAIIYGAQWSTALQNDWQSVADTGSGTQHIFSMPVSGHPTMFLRLTVTSQ